MCVSRRLLLSTMLIIPIVFLGLTLYYANGSAEEAYPPPETNIPSAPSGSNTIHLPLLSFNFPPPAAPSYYITNIATLYDLGYALGVHDRYTPGTQDNLVILDYGYPGVNGGVYGAKLTFDPTTFVSTADVSSSVFQFARGYYVGTGSDTTSHVRIVIGINSCCNENTLAFFQNHGTAWGQAANAAQTQISHAYSNQVDAVGGSDIEMSFNDPYTSAQWLNNFMTTSTCVPGVDNSVDGCFYNFGNLTISISGTTCATTEFSSWNACDVWYVSWGAQKNGRRFSRPLPEIYVRYNPNFPQYPWGQNATAWKELSLFSSNQMGAGKMYFVGTLTQRARCGDDCGAGNNYPSEGYKFLYNALNSDPTTSMRLRWSTDITIQPTSTP